jgi:hypothetical protein
MTAVVYRGHVTLARLVESLGEETLTGKVFAAYARIAPAEAALPATRWLHPSASTS